MESSHSWGSKWSEKQVLSNVLDTRYVASTDVIEEIVGDKEWNAKFIPYEEGETIVKGLQVASLFNLGLMMLVVLCSPAGVLLDTSKVEVMDNSCLLRVV